MSHESLPAELLQRKAVVYVRQDSVRQMHTRHDDQRNELAEVARRHGFTNIEVIDDDMGCSASSSVDRSSFDRLLAAVCAGEVGAVLCSDSSRLARNVRDWHRLIDLCCAANTRVIVTDAAYDPCRPDDRLLLGMNGSISELELLRIRTKVTECRVRRGDR
jgi:DNA invertase Pin-like site-specific DNA recombinase